MVKCFGWLFFAICAFSVVGFFFDWVDLHKNKDESRIEFYLNTGKISNDVESCYNTVVDLF